MSATFSRLENFVNPYIIHLFLPLGYWTSKEANQDVGFVTDTGGGRLKRTWADEFSETPAPGEDPRDS